MLEQQSVKSQWDFEPDLADFLLSSTCSLFSPTGFGQQDESILYSRSTKIKTFKDRMFSSRPAGHGQLADSPVVLHGVAVLFQVSKGIHVE